MVQTSNLEKRVFLERELMYIESKLLRPVNLTLYFHYGDDNSGPVIRMNLEVQGKGINNLGTRTILSEEYRKDKKAQRRYKEIIDKIAEGKYVLNLGSPGVVDPSINFL